MVGNASRYADTAACDLVLPLGTQERGARRDKGGSRKMEEQIAMRAGKGIVFMASGGRMR